MHFHLFSLSEFAALSRFVIAGKDGAECSPAIKAREIIMNPLNAQSHRSDPRILGRRTLERDHRTLARLLRPGLLVLDVGCGTGAITAGIARMVGAQGRVVGVDRDERLLELAREGHRECSNLQFEKTDATSLPYCAKYDIVTAARTLQWISDPRLAISKMKDAAKPGGLLVIMDYNHTKNEWAPDPPPAFHHFYRAFLDWRDANGWDNEMADHLPGLLEQAGLLDIRSGVEDEIAARGEADFVERARLWSEVIENLGEPISKAGFCTESELRAAHESYSHWVETSLEKQRLALRAVIGRVA
ncbi:MAG TPA: methyltransferase domain-containing protein [Bryobacteraceae bacterium]